MQKNPLLHLLEAILLPVRDAMAARFPRLPAYMALMRLDRPIGIYLLLWPTLWALWIAAEGLPSLHLLLVFTGGVILMRSAGCVINDFADRDLDPLVRRTRDRPLASGKVTPREALILFVGLGILAFMLVLTTNWLTLALVIPAALGTIVYPYMKRFTYMPQVVLGVVFSFGIPMAFAATQGRIPQAAWLLFIANLVWTVAYDTLYAMADREDDLKVGIRSTAILFGDMDRRLVGALQCLFLVALIGIGSITPLGGIYYLSLVPVACLLVYQQHLIRNREPAACLTAFSSNSLVGAVIFIGIFLDTALAGGQ